MGKCQTCLYFAGWRGDGPSLGLCQRHAPIAIPASSDSYGSITAWPRVSNDNGCGEYVEWGPDGE